MLALALLPARTTAQAVRNDLWMPDGDVNALAVSNNIVYVGGSFTHVGPPTGAFVGLDATSGTALQPYPLVGGGVLNVATVAAIAPDGNGGWFIGGTFSTVRDQPRANLAHLDAYGNVTVWNPGTDGEVNALAYSSLTGILYVGGHFSHVGGQPRSCLAAVDGGSGATSAWDPEPTGPNFVVVRTLATLGTTVYVGGVFTTIGGQPRNYLAAIDAGTGAATAWNPSPDQAVFAIAIDALISAPFTITVYIGGAFQNISGQPRGRIAAVDGGTGALLSWNPSASYEVHALAVRPARLSQPLLIYAGGGFTTIGGQTRLTIAALDVNGAATSWNPGQYFGGLTNTIGSVNSIMLGPAGVYAGGYFTDMGGQPRQSIAAIDPGTGAATSWNPGASSTVLALGQSGGAIFAGGQFTTTGGVPHKNLAALDAVSGRPLPWAPDPDGPVTALLATGSRIYVGGQFTTIGGIARNHVASLNDTGTVRLWDPDANDEVDAFAVRTQPLLQKSDVYMGGAFTSVAGQTRNHLAAFSDPSNTPTASLESWDPNANRNVHALMVSGSTIYAGGEFTSVNGNPLYQYLVALGTDGSVTRYVFDLDGDVNALALSDTLLCVGGAFHNCGGRPREGLALLTPTYLVANGWDPYTDGEPVYSLAVDATALYVGGLFSSLEFELREGLAALDLDTGLVTAWDASRAVQFGRSLAAGGGTVYVGGGFGSGEVWHTNLVGLSTVVTTAVEHGPVAEPGGLRAAPNPFRGEVTLRYTLPRAGPAQVLVFDLSGRLLRRFRRGALSAGEQQVTWDGRDDAGTEVGTGVYFVRVAVGSLDLTAKVLRLK